ncbi:triose phosphate phosphate translocator [Chrysochromulina tobinii]|uniref:Triose phosphate phosphate translocator n=1 Tax=Chrysochromulina tobinii TaxID=1460289 RepID=A0A0M0JX95_9EUKA|nr:triose phosphate phosphate translocator [Chrysochromulina tobinii]|eukprot:KOO30758.1 triose phosphate phosphate translocator [Chrysochromulina sp. CCMP291]
MAIGLFGLLTLTLCASASAELATPATSLPVLKLRGGARPASALVAAKPVAKPVEAKGTGIDVGLLLCFAGWYLGNYYYTLNNKYALNAAGGATGFPITIGFLQMCIGSLYALFLWLAPDARPLPTVTFNDLAKIVPVATCSAGAHLSSIISMNLGAVSFSQIVKAAEPAFAALLGVTMYGKSISKAKWLCLIPVIGGVCLASIKELDFSVVALIAACVANVFAAFRANENKKVMDTPGLNDRIGSTGNQFAISTLLGALSLLPVWLMTEASRFGKFLEIFKSSAVLRNNLITSGLYFYLYNELSTITIKKTSATTQSVANTAKRVIVIVGVALALGESLEPIKLLGCSIGIGGVLLYSLVK